MRNDGGFEIIKKAIEKLGLRHKEHIAAYGEGNERRLTGRHETADINTFIWVRNEIPAEHSSFLAPRIVAKLTWALGCWTGSCKQGSIHSRRQRHREGRERVLRGQKACFQHGPLYGDFHDCRDHHLVESMSVCRC